MTDKPASLRASLRPLAAPVIAMSVVIAVANYAVQFPVNEGFMADILTWGAFAYPLTFLVTDLTNRLRGASLARRVIYVAFPIGLLVTLAIGTPPRIAFASLTAFLIGQLGDIAVFNRWRRAPLWWKAPLLSSAAGSIIDTAIFFTLAFAGTTGWAIYGIVSAPIWVGWAVGDLTFKGFAAFALLLPYRAALARFAPDPHRAASDARRD